jgi:hypothetical protein
MVVILWSVWRLIWRRDSKSFIASEFVYKVYLLLREKRTQNLLLFGPGPRPLL